MTLSAGTRLGPYEILSPIGAGGMGEVYKARDTRLERTSRSRCSPPTSRPARRRASASSARRRRSRSSRIRTSARSTTSGARATPTTSSWSILEGETLADRLGKGPLPTEQILRYGIEIADALDKAHRQGIVHRDLKPGNVMITKTGVKLLDFGLAKPLTAAGARPVSGASVMATEAQASAPLTERGTILGTFQYMSPEQLEGGEADGRSDIFAFGSVLYEMATGRKAFTGKSQASLIGSILRDDPPSIVEAAPMIPPALNRVVKTCLAKDPEDRFQTAHDAKLQLEWIAEGGSQAGLPAPVIARRKNREKLAWAVAAVAVLAAAAFAFGFWRRAPRPTHTMRFDVDVPPDVSTVDMPRISPDGRILAFNAIDSSGKNRIWVRPLNALAAHPLAGTEGTRRPFWSPDSKFLAFIADGKLQKVDVAGGPPQKICDAPTAADGTWSPEGVILFDGTGTDPIWRVPASGGVPVVLVKPDASRKETQIGWPEVLPDGRHFLYMAMGDKAPEGMYRVASLDGKENRPFAPAQSAITYVEPGYLLYLRDRTLVAQRFDAKSVKTTGEPVPLAEGVGTDGVGLARFSVSREGTLVYRTGEINDRMVWVDRTGRELESVADPAQYHDPAISPDGRRLAYELIDARTGKSDVWTRDLSRGVSSRFSFSKVDAFSASLVAGRPSPRLHGAAGPGRKTGGRTGNGNAAPQFGRAQDCERLVSRRTLHRVRGPGEGIEVGHLDPADVRRQEAVSLAEDQLLGDLAHFFARRAVFGVPIERVRPPRDLRPELPGAGRKVADLLGRRHRAALARRRQGALLPLRRSEAHGRRHDARCDAGGRRAEAALSGSSRDGPRAQPVRAVEGRPALPSRGHAVARVDVADDGRPELDGRAGEVK